MMKRVARILPLMSFILLMSFIAVLPHPAAAATDYTLTVTKGGTGGGKVTSSPTGIACGTTCSFDFGPGTMVTLTAAPNDKSTFIEWTGDCSGSTCDVTMDAAKSVNARFDLTYRPDAVIKLCGLSTGCTIDPLPHPWKGNNIYNSTGAGQTIKNVSIDNGEGVRFWFRVENDGVSADTIVVQGCKGNDRFMVNKVLLGKHKKPEAGVTNVTHKFLNGTLDFSLPPKSEHKHKFFTLNILTQGMVLPVKYTCKVTMSSQGDPSLTDTVVMKMDMY